MSGHTLALVGLIISVALLAGFAILAVIDGRRRVGDALHQPEPFPTYDPSDDAPFSAGTETDIQQAPRLAADSGDPDAQTVDRIRERVMDELATRRARGDSIRFLQ